MKNIIFLLAFTFTVNVGRSQSPTQLNVMINNCLDSCLSIINISSLLIDHYPFYFMFSDSIKNRQLDYVSITNPKFYKYFERGKFVLFFDGIFLEQNRLIIQFSKRFVQFERMNFTISLSKWVTFTYEYSCDEEQWVFIEKEINGI